MGSIPIRSTEDETMATMSLPKMLAVLLQDGNLNSPEELAIILAKYK